MHTFTGKGCWIHHNSDMSGDIIIEAQDVVVDGKTLQGIVTITIPGSDILAFVADHIRYARISKLEQMTTEELLKFISMIGEI